MARAVLHDAVMDHFPVGYIEVLSMHLARELVVHEAK